MTLTVGTSPFGQAFDGTLNFSPPERVVLVQPVPRRIRAVVAGETVVDSENAKLVHVSGVLPVYAFPAADVTVDGHEHPDLEGHVVVPWNAVDAWYEEDERVYVHPRDPFHRIDVFPTSRRIEVRIEGTLVAESVRAKALYETSLPVRYYLPAADVRPGILEPSDTVTECAYKGTTRHLSALIDGKVIDDVAWIYEDEVRREAEDVRGRIAFYNERVDLVVDGKASERPGTPWYRSPG